MIGRLCFAHPKTVAEASAGGRAGGAEVTADSWLLIGCSVQIRHRPRTTGAQEAGWARGGGACGEDMGQQNEVMGKQIILKSFQL